MSAVGGVRAEGRGWLRVFSCARREAPCWTADSAGQPAYSGGHGGARARAALEPRVTTRGPGRLTRLRRSLVADHCREDLASASLEHPIIIISVQRRNGGQKGSAVVRLPVGRRCSSRRVIVEHAGWGGASVNWGESTVAPLASERRIPRPPALPYRFCASCPIGYSLLVVRHRTRGEPILALPADGSDRVLPARVAPRYSVGLLAPASNTTRMPQQQTTC